MSDTNSVLILIGELKGKLDAQHTSVQNSLMNLKGDLTNVQTTQQAQQQFMIELKTSFQWAKGLSAMAGGIAGFLISLFLNMNGSHHS